MKTWNRIALIVFSTHFLFNNLVDGVSVIAQEASSNTRLVDDSAIESLANSTRDDLIEVITRPVDEKTLAILLTRVGEMESKLDAKLRQLETAATNAADATVQSRQRSLLWLSRVELSVLKSELFAESSQDAIAAAINASKAARSALAALPNAGNARQEILRLLVEAYVRQGDAKAAANAMSEAREESRAREESVAKDDVQTDDQWRALQIRIALAGGDRQQAKAMLDHVYGDNPETAAASTGLDLARLRYLMAEEEETEIGRWLDAIEKRSGENARDRAETMVAQKRELTRNRSGSGNASAASLAATDPRLWIADAMYFLRRGQPEQSALHFAKAAAADREATRSVRSAMKAASILAKQGNVKAAVELLRQISVRHVDSPVAADAILQAAVLAQSAGPEVIPTDVVRKLLVETSRRWPETPAAKAAIDWQFTWAQTEQRWLDAAYLAAQTAPVHWDETVADRCVSAWAQAWLSEGDSIRPKMREAMDERVAKSNRRGDLVQSTYANLVVLMEDITSTAFESMIERASEGFFENLGRFRASQTNRLTKAASEEAVIQLAVIARLEKDVSQRPDRRADIANALLSQSGAEFRSDRQRFAWLAWAGRPNEADAMILRLIEDQPDEASAILRRAAEVYQVSTSTADQKRAQHWWKKLADGLPRSSDLWHDATLGWLMASMSAGEKDTARVSAKMILLTTPPNDRERRVRYEKMAE